MSHRNNVYPSIFSSASLWDCSQVSERPKNSKFLLHILFFIKGTLLGTVCGHKPCMFKNAKLLVSVGMWVECIGNLVLDTDSFEAASKWYSPFVVVALRGLDTPVEAVELAFGLQLFSD